MLWTNFLFAKTLLRRKLIWHKTSIAWLWPVLVHDGETIIINILSSKKQWWWWSGVIWAGARFPCIWPLLQGWCTLQSSSSTSSSNFTIIINSIAIIATFQWGSTYVKWNFEKGVICCCCCCCCCPTFNCIKISWRRCWHKRVAACHISGLMPWTLHRYYYHFPWLAI